MMRGTVYMVAPLGSPQAPAGLKEQTRGTRGTEGKMKEKGETCPTSKMRRTGMALG